MLDQLRTQLRRIERAEAIHNATNTTESLQDLRHELKTLCWQAEELRTDLENQLQSYQ